MLKIFFLAIREDRTRGGRSTYQCSYSIPPSLASLGDLQTSVSSLCSVKLEPTESPNLNYSQKRLTVPTLLQVIIILNSTIKPVELNSQDNLITILKNLMNSRK